MESLRKYQSVYDIPVKSQYGEDNFLAQFRGKVLVFVNTTGHCGNARQWPILDSIAKEYQDKNVQFIYVPTNDYCGSVTFGDYIEGIKDGKESADYAKKTYGIDAPFTELLSSRDEPWVYKLGTLNRETGIITLNEEQQQQAKLLHQEPRSELFAFLAPLDVNLIGGNFFKWVTNSQGLPVASFDNSTFNDGSSMVNAGVASIEDEIAFFKKCLDEILETGVCTHKTYGYSPYSP